VWNHYSSPTIEGCIFSLNTVTGSGGGIYNNRYSWPLIKQCSITSNRALDYGGGIANHDLCSPEITNCKFSANTAGGGGGIYNNSSSPMVKNCTFAAHWTFGSSDDVYNEGSTPRFSNCIFWFAGRSGSPIYADTSSNVEIKYSLVQGGFAGPGNINTDPQFVRNPSWLSHEIDYGDLQLQLDSPCNDAGTRSDAPATDFESTFRPQGSGIDIGAYELLHPALPIFTLNVAANGSGTITPPPGSYLVQSGSVITFSVLPSLNWLWSGWSGALEGLESSRTLVVSNNTTVIANFTELTAQGNLSGVVTDWRSGLPILGVQIDLFEEQFSQDYGTTSTNVNGAYIFTAPQTLPMRLDFSIDNYLSAERSGVIIPTTLNVALEPIFSRSACQCNWIARPRQRACALGSQFVPGYLRLLRLSRHHERLRVRHPAHHIHPGNHDSVPRPKRRHRNLLLLCRRH
jgi:hypothetical protein